MRRLWARDATLWTGRDEAQWLGWLGIANGQLAHLERFAGIREAARTGGFSHVLLLGMGGSSLVPRGADADLRPAAGLPRAARPRLHRSGAGPRVREPDRSGGTLFIVSSKSGTTLEPNIFKQYFFERAAERSAPGGGPPLHRHHRSRLEAAADGRERGFPARLRRLAGHRRALLGAVGLRPGAGGGDGHRRREVPRIAPTRWCGLHAVGRRRGEPGRRAGHDPRRSARAGSAATRSRSSPRRASPTSAPGWSSWSGESTGKDGKGIIPIDREALGPPEVYGDDRLFVYMRLRSAPDAARTSRRRAGARRPPGGAHRAGRRRTTWGRSSSAGRSPTAVAGAIIGINPFDQPDVEASKIATRKLTAEYERTGALPAETPIFSEGQIALFADATNAAALDSGARERPRASPALLAAHLGRLADGDYFALLAYIEMNAANERALQAHARSACATRAVSRPACGSGRASCTRPARRTRAGPNTRRLPADHLRRRARSSRARAAYTFGVVKAAQARGDFQVLAERGRRALRVHLGGDLPGALSALQTAMRAALAF